MGQSRVKEGGGGYSFITVVSLKGWNPTCGFGAEAIDNGKYNTECLLPLLAMAQKKLHVPFPA